MYKGLTQITQQEVASSKMVANVRAAFADACAGITSMDRHVLEIEGMSGRRYRQFINNLVRRTEDARYLEVGVWKGSTLCAAISNNKLRATAIDNWSEFGGPRDEFFANLAACKPAGSPIEVMEKDFRQVDFGKLGPFNIFLFDGPHDKQDQFEGIAVSQPALDNEFVLVVDDWNWMKVREGTFEAIQKLDLMIAYGLEIRTTLDDSIPELHSRESDWHNGYFIAVMRRPRGVFRLTNKWFRSSRP